VCGGRREREREREREGADRAAVPALDVLKVVDARHIHLS